MTIKYEDLHRLTTKQQAALNKAEERAEAITESSLGLWDISFRDETRPGRGHDITAWYADGEHLVVQYLDPYGSGPLVVSSLDLIHNDDDEEHFNDEGNCGCPGGDS